MQWSFHQYRMCIAALMAIPSALCAKAQQSGHYLQGISGLDNGTVAPPGVYISFLPWVNLISSYRGADGQKLESLGLNVAAHNVVFQGTIPQKFLGSQYALEVILPAVNSRVVDATSATAAPQPGVSDLFVSPLILGWTERHAHYLLSYGFYAPTGDFDPTKSQNSGLGFWEQQVQGGMSYSFDKKGLWNASALSTWEINQSKTALDLKPGPMVNVEYSLGHRFNNHKVNLGAAGYAYQKLSPDSGTDAVRLSSLARDHSFGVGPEFKYINPAKHFAFDLRYERQFAVKSKTEGDVFVAGVTWVNVLAPKDR
jgi:hypothetical protein